MAAVLLKLPSIVRSEQYAHVNPHAHRAYVTHVQREKDADKILDRLIEQANNSRDKAVTTPTEQDSFIEVDDEEELLPDNVPEQPPVRTELHDPKAILYDLGYMEKFHVREGKKTYSYVFPQCSLYANRGQTLKHLNRLEYASLIRFKECPKTISRQTDFPFSEGYIIHGLAVQAIMAKQKTPLVIRKPPRHPGKRPSPQSPRYQAWLEAANHYAEFYLLLFRPEPECCEKKQINRYEYTWDALETFVQELQQDNSILSKFRLVAMHTRMRGFVTSFRSKLILTKYRARDRDMWSKEQLKMWETRAAWERMEGKVNDILSQYAFEAEHSDLGQARTQALRRKLAVTTSLTDAFCDTFDAHEATYSSNYKPFPTSNTQQPTHLRHSPPDIQELGTCIRRFDKEGPPPAAHAKQRYSYHLFPRLQRRHKHRETIGKFKHRQRQLYDIYKQYLKDPADKKNAPPPILMLHGGAGTGKSTLLQAILDYADFRKQKTIRTAFNGINALHIRGETTWSFLQMEAGIDSKTVRGMTPNQLPHFRERMQETKLVVVDELSNQAPWHLAKLNMACQQAMDNDLPFGGIPVILCGDLVQLEPVRAGLSLPAAIIEMCENVWSKPSTKHRKHLRAKLQAKQKRSKSNDVELDTDHRDAHHPFAHGANIINLSRLYELDEQVRSDDPQHSAFVTSLFNCNPPEMTDLMKIPLLSHEDFLDPDSPWFKAPILVMTHRERHSLTHEAAIRFAKATGKPVIRWKAHTENWKQAPPEHLKHEAYSDPCFYEYFVQGAEAFLNVTISKTLGLVNAQSFKCHSLTLHMEEQQQDLNQRIETSVPGEIITLPQEPLAVNAEINIKHFTNEQLHQLENFRLSFADHASPQPPQTNPSDCSLDDDNDSYSDAKPLRPLPTTANPKPNINDPTFTIPRKKPKPQPEHQPFVIPITQAQGKLSKNAAVYGTSNIKPSEIDIKPHFPFQLAFVMTVNKSEGQTMPNAILALSERPHARFNFTFRHLYVACSRVRKRQHNRLLLTGRRHRKYHSLHYLTLLKPPWDSASVLKGFRARGGPGWEDDIWDPHSTLRYWERHN